MQSNPFFKPLLPPFRAKTQKKSNFVPIHLPKSQQVRSPLSSNLSPTKKKMVGLPKIISTTYPPPGGRILFLFFFIFLSKPQNLTPQVQDHKLQTPFPHSKRYPLLNAFTYPMTSTSSRAPGLEPVGRWPQNTGTPSHSTYAPQIGCGGSKGVEPPLFLLRRGLRG